MRITRPLAVLFGAAAFIGAVSPATAQLALGPLDKNGQGPIPPVYAQELRQNVDRPSASNDVNQDEKLPPKGPPLWQIIPRAEIAEEITDNVRNTTTGRQADLITTFNPGVYVSADSPRLAANLDYSPGFQKYAVASDQDRIDQNLFGTAIATLVPDTLGFETRGAIFDSAHTGAFGGIPTSQLASNQRTETYTVEASPVLRHSFNTIGDGELRYIAGETWFGGQTAATGLNAPGFVGTGTTQPISNALHQELRATLDTGGVSKYVSNRVTLDGQRNDVNGGTGSNKEGLATDEVTLHLRNNFALVGSGGWQTLEFARVPSQNLNEPTWYAGFVYEPNADSQISLNYGHRDGGNSFEGDMRYAITPLTTVYGNYSEVITTPQQAILQNLNGAVLGPNGSVLNASTGLPQALNNNELSLQNNIERLRTFQASIVTTLNPNRFALTFDHQETTSLTGAVPNDAINGGVFTWDRQLSPLNNLTFILGYSARAAAHTNTFNTSLAFRHAFSPTLFGEIDYSFIDVSSVPGGTNFFRNSLIFTLRKVF